MDQAPSSSLTFTIASQVASHGFIVDMSGLRHALLELCTCRDHAWRAVRPAVKPLKRWQLRQVDFHTPSSAHMRADGRRRALHPIRD